ncbi:hypothetical protein EPN83_03360 [Patescibacteria group bacterium]|nr:MAG: hypothetical protein EPN83_03360 [Patescibacteria group bacterium]
MIYLLHGNNFNKVRGKLRQIVNSQMKKKPDAAHFRISEDNWSEGRLEEFTSSQGLFITRFLIVLDGLLLLPESGEVVLSKLEEISLSPNIFIFVEGEMPKELIKRVSKYVERVQEFSDAKKTKSTVKEFNVFTLTDALGARDRKRLWILFQRGLREGIEPEEMHRLFFWQVKAMIAARGSKGASEAGLNPFVYRKSLGFARNFTKDELNKLSSDLVRLYHDTRRGILDFDIALERFVLGI